MEAVVRELKGDAQLGVFLDPECNVSAIASAVVARDSASRDVNASGSSLRSHSSSASSFAGAGGGGDESEEPSQSEQLIERIDTAVQRIDRVISEHIGEHHATLLEQVGSVDGLQSHVTSVQASVDHLKQAVHGLEAMVRDQHDNLRATIQRHRNVEQCSDIVRRVLRFQQLSDRVLGSVLAHTDTGAADGAKTAGLANEARQSEMATVALAIREMELLAQDANFEELSVVRAKLPAIRKLSASMKREARASLHTGIESLSQADVGDALQILFYLGDLGSTAQSTVNDVIQEVERLCTAAIAEDKLLRSAASSGNLGASASPATIVQKTDLWKAIQDVFEVIRVHALQVWNLERVLVKMVDPSSGKKYVELVLEPEEPSLFATFWEVTCALVRELFGATLGYSTAVKTVLIAEYPRMRDQATRVLNELHATTNQSAGADFLVDTLESTVDDDSNASSKEKTGKKERRVMAIAGSMAERTQLLDSMSPLYDAFIDRAYRRMANPIQLMFPQSSNFHASPPGRSDMQTLARTIFSELEQAGQDPVLLEGALRQVRKAVGLFCSNVKRIMHQGKAAAVTMPSYGRTPAQAHNVGLMNVLSLLDDAVEEVGNRVEAAAANSSSSTTKTTPSGVSGRTTGMMTPKEAKALCTKELTPCRELIAELEYALMGYYLQALATVLEDIFAKMHDESFGDQPTTATSPASGEAQRGSGSFRQSRGSTGGSKYMHEFGSAFAVVLEEHLRRLPIAAFATNCLSDLVARMISVFIRHASLVRPLTESGKLRLANDMAQLELRLEHIVPLRTLGAPYEELRAFRHMIFLENAELLRDSTIDKIRPSNVWHHLTSRAPAELQLPHQVKRWTAAKYIDWLDTRVPLGAESSSPSSTPPSSSSGTGKSPATSLSWQDLPLGYPCLKDPRLALRAEKEAWKEMAKCLDAYAQRVSAASGAEMSPIYELLQESSAILLAGYEVTSSR